MNYVAIPSEVFEAQEYRSLTVGNREFLLRLYHLFGDCQTFTIDYKAPEQYGETINACMNYKLKCLLKSGLVMVKEKPAIDSRGPRPRILAFTYPAVEAYQ